MSVKDLHVEKWSHGLKLNEYDPVGESGRKERGDETSVDVEKPASRDPRVLFESKKQNLKK